MPKTTQCPHCATSLTEYERLFHYCRQALQTMVPREKCGCGAVSTECLQDGTLVCASCYQHEVESREYAAADQQQLREETTRGRWPR